MLRLVVSVSCLVLLLLLLLACVSVLLAVWCVGGVEAVHARVSMYESPCVLSAMSAERRYGSADAEEGLAPPAAGRASSRS